MRIFSGFLFLAIVLAAGSAFGQWYCAECLVTMPNFSGYGDLALFVLPDGTGSPFDQAQIRDDGAVVDATIELYLTDDYGIPAVDFPAEDIWLESSDGGMIPCVGGTQPDANTNTDGLTWWTTPLKAGGYSTDLLLVYANGLPVPGSPLTLAINSADMNGDGLVNLADVGMFSTDFFGDYAFRADFYADGVLNLADVGRLATGLGASCP